MILQAIIGIINVTSDYMEVTDATAGYVRVTIIMEDTDITRMQ